MTDINYYTATAAPAAVFADDFSFAIFDFPLIDGGVRIRFDREMLSAVAGRLSEVSAHMQTQTALAQGHVSLVASPAMNIGADALLGGHVGVRVQTENGVAQVYALTPDQARALADRLLEIEPQARAESVATRQ